jgi:hypothetical protein
MTGTTTKHSNMDVETNMKGSDDLEHIEKEVCIYLSLYYTI